MFASPCTVWWHPPPHRQALAPFHTPMQPPPGFHHPRSYLVPILQCDHGTNAASVPRPPLPSARRTCATPVRPCIPSCLDHHLSRPPSPAHSRIFSLWDRWGLGCGNEQGWHSFAWVNTVVNFGGEGNVGEATAQAAGWRRKWRCCAAKERCARGWKR